MALGLRNSGCSIGASLAYWIGNPILNPATVIFMGFVLGWHWVGLRLAAGVVLVFGVAYVVQWLVHPEPLPGDGGLPTDQVAEADVRGGSIWTRWLAALWKLAVGLVPEYVVLVLLLGAARAWFFPAVDSNATGFLWTLGLALAGTLFVIPTAGGAWVLSERLGDVALAEKREEAVLQFGRDVGFLQLAGGFDRSFIRVYEGNTGSATLQVGLKPAGRRGV